MAMTEGYRNAIAGHGGSLIKYIGLVNGSGVELSGGTYARKAVTWTTAADGVIRPTADLVFDVPAGATVAGWRAYSAATAGTNYGGAALPEETFNGAGQYRLLAANTGILHKNE
jgi:hypothetical protein